MYNQVKPKKLLKKQLIKTPKKKYATQIRNKSANTNLQRIKDNLLLFKNDLLKYNFKRKRILK